MESENKEHLDVNGKPLEGFVPYEEETDDGGLDAPVEPKEEALEEDVDLSFLETPKDGTDPSVEDPVELNVHGEVIKVTPQKLRDLAQIGHVAQSKLGPYQKMISLYENDEEMRSIFQRHLEKRKREAQGLPPLEEPEKGGRPKEPLVPEFEASDSRQFEDDKAWMLDNVKRALQANNALWEKQLEDKLAALRKAQDSFGQRGQPQKTELTGEELLMRYDPMDYDQVAPYLPVLARKTLTIEKLQAFNSDKRQLVKWYDEMKGALKRKGVIDGGETPPNPLEPDVEGGIPMEPVQRQQSKKKAHNIPFRAKSKGGEQPQNKGTDAWDMSVEQFESILSRVKGEG